MKEQPILFSDQRVRNLLMGQQTQTRRIMKPLAFTPAQDNHEGCYGFDVINNHLQGHQFLEMSNLSYQCPFGQLGDILWVRETWRGPVVPTESVADYTRSPAAFRHSRYCQAGWQTAIHMPRWASRINLRINDIRVEKIQDISDDDIAAEGIQTDLNFLNNFFTMNSDLVMPKDIYKKAWTQQYGGTSWEVNPWVWVIGFEKI